MILMILWARYSLVVVEETKVVRPGPVGTFEASPRVSGHRLSCVHLVLPGIVGHSGDQESVCTAQKDVVAYRQIKSITFFFLTFKKLLLNINLEVEIWGLGYAHIFFRLWSEKVSKSLLSWILLTLVKVTFHKQFSIVIQIWK